MFVEPEYFTHLTVIKYGNHLLPICTDVDTLYLLIIPC